MLLLLDVEVLSWSRRKDICGDGGIMKKTLRAGKGSCGPTDLDMVKVNFEVCLEDGTIVSKSLGVDFPVNDGFFCPAMAIAVKHMCEKEKSLFFVESEYGFGTSGRVGGKEGAIPPDAKLRIELELVSWKTVTKKGDDKGADTEDSS